MPKLTCPQIRDRAFDLLREGGRQLRPVDIKRQIASESPETPVGTIAVQVGEAFKRYARLEAQNTLDILENGPKSSFAPPSETRIPLDTLPATTYSLASLGFVLIGGFDYDGPHVRRSLVQHADRCPALYAFVIDGTVMYLGKSVTPLSKRLHFYVRPGPTQSTNIRNHASIRAALDEGRRIEIWALVDWEAIEYRGIPINVAAGIEDTLIERMNPAWNVRRATN